VGGFGSDHIVGGPGTATDVPRVARQCGPIRDPDSGFVATVEANQALVGGDDPLIFPVPSDDGNDRLEGGGDNDYLRGGSDTNDLSGKGGDDCLTLQGDENERASGGYGNDIIFSDDFGAASSNGDDIFCGAGIDLVRADAQDRVAAGCENVIRPSSLQAPGATPEAEVTITTPEGTITMTP
jgi:Ca2+-binding RTX toxin-like protein